MCVTTVLIATFGATSCNSAGGGGTVTPPPPPPPTYTIGGTISGLSGAGLVLQNNGGNNLSVGADGNFTFTSPVSSGGAYNVSVFTQPSNPAQMCTVTNGTGTASANVSDVEVTCSTTTTTTFTIGGTVSGLSGTGLVLQNNGGDNLAITGDGTFTFATAIAASSAYNVTVLTQPSNPTQTCSVVNSGGTASANVTNVSVTCSTTTFTIGGSLSGLSSGTVVLQNNGADNLSLAANGTFTFATPVAAGSAYSVTVKTQPTKQFCSVLNGGGTANANITNVQVSCTATTGNTISETFFGASFNFFTTWPPTDGLGRTASLGTIRLWDDMIKWGQVNTSRGSYDWSMFDDWVALSQSLNAEILYTFGDTPAYAGTIPTGNNIHCLAPSDYSCSPPNDVNADGTGTDADFSAFVTAVVTRYKGKIAYYELWNEPDCSCYFAGTQAQMVRMNKDAAAIIRSIDPNAKLLSPSGHVWTLDTWFDAYIQAGGAAAFDIVNFHMRSTGDLNITPESFIGTYSNIKSAVAAHNLSNLPIWDSEHGIRASENVTDPDILEGYVARELALRAGLGLPRQYLYSWDDNPPVGLQGNLGGTAYNTVANWLIGHSINACVATGTVYTCDVDDGQIVWDTAQTCSAGVCTTSNYTYPASYHWKTDLTAVKTALSGATVPIGYKPIFLTAQ
jgi:Cellulase (glycosyl hydrolase family 5)